MNTANLNTLIQRYEDNFEWINNAEHDELSAVFRMSGSAKKSRI